MKIHNIKVYPSKIHLPKNKQLAWKIAEIASDNAKLDKDAIEMVINRIIDNASVAIASLERSPVANARAMAVNHPRHDNKGATIFGMPNNKKFHAEWAAWANCTAVRELDYHDTFLAADYSHPADSIPAVLAVAQQLEKSGKDLLKGIVASYELHVNLVKAICLHEHKIDHVAHLCPAQAAGICAMLNLDIDTTYQAIQQALHVSISTRQSRKGEISSWKAYVPAHGAKLAIEAVDRAMRGEGAPSPIYEGEDSVLAWILDGPESDYLVPLPSIGNEKKAILETYTKEHSAEYQSQALIDMAFRMREHITDFSLIKNILIETSHHTHYVIGTGAQDPQKMDPKASRETLDHSIMYIFAVALLDGRWHHIDSYTRAKAQNPETISIWHKISTVEKPYWTKAYHEKDPNKKVFGGKVIITMNDGTTIEDEIKRANAHPSGARPFVRENYIEKFDMLTNQLITNEERNRFIGLVENLKNLSSEEVKEINVQVANLSNSTLDSVGIF